MQQALGAHLGSPALRAVLLDAEGPHFSFGASVDEHMPEQCAQMLKTLHALVRQMLDSPVPILVAIRGQCLGGGLEVAAAGNLLFVAPDARLGQPEIRLGVFAPAASCLLPPRVGAPAPLPVAAKQQGNPVGEAKTKEPRMATVKESLQVGFASDRWSSRL